MSSPLLEPTIEWLTPAASFCAALIGVLVAHYFTSRRDVANKRRELLSKAFMGIWNDLQFGHLPESENDFRRLEGAIAGIQLYGSDEAIQIAKRMRDELEASGSTDASELIVKFRSELRNALGMPDTVQPYFHYRVNSPKRGKK